MARATCMATSGIIAVSANATRKTLLGLTAPANQVVAWLRCVVSCEGVTSGDKPLLFEVGTVTGGTSAGVTERMLDGWGLTPQAAGLTYSVEPTWTSYIPVYVHPMSGYELVLQVGQDEIEYYNATWAVGCTQASGNAGAVNVVCNLWWEE